MKFRSLSVHHTAWPKGSPCTACGRPLKWGDVSLAARSAIGGTVAFHKECIIKLVSVEFPDSRYDKIKSMIKENGMFGFKVEEVA